MEWTLVSFAMSSSALVAHWWNRQPDSLYVISSNYVKAIVPLEPSQFLSDIRYSFTFLYQEKRKTVLPELGGVLIVMLAWLMNLKLFFTLSDNQKRKIISISCF